MQGMKVRLWKTSTCVEPLKDPPWDWGTNIKCQHDPWARFYFSCGSGHEKNGSGLKMTQDDSPIRPKVAGIFQTWMGSPPRLQEAIDQAKSVQLPEEEFGPRELRPCLRIPGETSSGQG